MSSPASQHRTRKVWDIHGGVHPLENKAQSTQSPIGHIALPNEIVLPLSQHIGQAAIPVVSVGDRVLKGQKIADAQGMVSAPIHASTSGTVSAIEERLIPHPSGMRSFCIVITPDGQDTWAPLEPCEDYHALDHHTLVEKIRQAGIAGMGGAGFPTAIKLNPRADNDIHTLILNGTECEPYITADDMLMRERAEQVIAGAELLAKILNYPAEVLIGIEDNKPEAIAAMQAALASAKQAQSLKAAIEIVSFPTKYPSGGEKQLIQILTGKEVPSGKIPANIGVVVQNVGTAVAAWRAVRYGEPLISRITTVVGENVSQQRNIEVLLGTPIRHVLAAHGYQEHYDHRLIIGGPMMGFTIEQTDVPVVKTTNCILAPSKAEMGLNAPAQACIRCGMCAEVCPANLLPQQLFWYSQAQDHDKLEDYNLFDCIECGACSYVCPSSIPLVQYYRASKGTIREQEKAKQHADRARERFEARKARVEKAEAEKEAKREARKRAAEEAKKQLAAKQAQASATNTAAPDTENQNTSASIVDTPIGAPSTPAAAIDPAKQRAKLERAFSSAKSRVERAQEQLATAQANHEDAARITALEARLKQAQQKVTEAQAKLAEADNAGTTPTNIGAERIVEKMQMSAIEKLEKTIATLEKRVHTAEEKLAEAEQANAPTTAALKQGVEKLQQKLADTRSELEVARQAEAASTGSTNDKESATDNPEQSAAAAAIAKAQAKSAAQASMTDEEKQAQHKAALIQRLEKARERLQKAEADNNDNMEAFRLGVEKLEQKLHAIEAAEAGE